MRIRRAERPDLAALEALLVGAGLPTAGVEAALPGFLVAEEDGRLVGAAGLEVHGSDGLLRSVVVEDRHRGRGLAGRLTAGVLDGARASGLRRVYLLTTTAEGYFSRHGFRRIDRSEASPEVQGSVEFREACPASAAAMVLELETDG